MRLLLCGATGFIGTKLIDEMLRGGHSVHLLTRNPENIPTQLQNKVPSSVWDGHKVGQWAENLNSVDAVINLSGESIAGKRWTPAQKRRIVDSRIQSTRALVAAIKKANIRPKALINASAVGYYGNVPEGDVKESSPKGEGFLSETCLLWEEEARRAFDLGLRVVTIRTGIVLEKSQGALAKMLLPFRLFIGGPLGSGKQWFPWIHLEDEVRAIRFVLEDPKLQGPVNLTAPNPVRLKEFCKVLGSVLGRPSWAPVPAFVLKIILGEMASLLLEGQRAMPEKLAAAGFKFRYPDLQPALQAILKS